MLAIFLFTKIQKCNPNLQKSLGSHRTLALKMLKINIGPMVADIFVIFLFSLQIRDGKQSLKKTKKMAYG